MTPTKKHTVLHIAAGLKYISQQNSVVSHQPVGNIYKHQQEIGQPGKEQASSCNWSWSNLMIDYLH